MNLRHWCLVSLCLCATAGLAPPAYAQKQDPLYGQGFRVDLDSTKQKYIRILTWHQFWVRWGENNPGSLDNGEARASQADFAIRRSRILFVSQLSSRFLVLMHLGINNQTLLSGGGNGQGATGADGKKPQIFMHDIWAEYTILKDRLSFGAGLHYWNGTSRMTNTSTIYMMTIDAPIHNWYNIDATDQFGRYPGMYAKGKLLKNSRIDYRVALDFPFIVPKANALAAVDTISAYKGTPSTGYRGVGASVPMTTGYIQYQFFDVEANLLPYTSFSYLGAKKILNLGAGWTYAPDMMWTASRNANTGRVDTARAAQKIFTVDVCLDMPLGAEKKTALAVYASASHFDMGKNYVRNIGISNPANSGNAQRMWSGVGNSVPTVGTGTILYGQAGFLLPNTPIGKFQPYVACTHAKYERVADAVVIPDFGLNYYISNHNAKITFNYRVRPYFDYSNPADHASSIVHKGSKPELTLQFQVAL